MSKYMIIKRDTGSSKYGHDYRDCKILGEVDDVDEALSIAKNHGYYDDEHNFGGVRILKEVVIKAVEEDA